LLGARDCLFNVFSATLHIWVYGSKREEITGRWRNRICKRFVISIIGPTRLLDQWVQGAPSLGVKQPGREAGRSPPSSAEIKERVELFLHSPNTPPWRGAQLIAQGEFILPLVPE